EFGLCACKDAANTNVPVSANTANLNFSIAMSPSCGTRFPGIDMSRLFRTDVYYVLVSHDFLFGSHAVPTRPGSPQLAVEMDERIHHERHTETGHRKENPHAVHVFLSDRSVFHEAGR